MSNPSASLDWESLSLRFTFAVITGIAIVFLIAPSLIVILTSLTASASLRFPPAGLSLRWYAALLNSDQMLAAAWTSLIVAFWTTIICAILGTAAALALSRSKPVWARSFDLLFMSPLLLPALAFGFAALVFIYSLVRRTTVAGRTQLEPALLEAPASLGADQFMSFRRVTLPLIGRGVGAGSFLAFMASFDNVPVSLFLADERTEVLPIHLWQQIETNLDVRTAAVSGVIVVITLLLMLVAERFAGVTSQMR